MKELEDLKKCIKTAFADTPSPLDKPIPNQSFHAIALDLPLMSQDAEYWYIPQIMTDILDRLIRGEDASVEIEQIIFSLDPEGTFKSRSSNVNEMRLYQQRLLFLQKFNQRQRLAICQWVEIISALPETENYFRAIQRINNRLCQSS